ncbi:MAG: hypothetical protein ACYDG2_25800, partial [Ruminiclostridium sp.]
MHEYSKRIIDIVDKVYSTQILTQQEHNELVSAMKRGTKAEKIYLARVISRLKKPEDLNSILKLLNMQNSSLSLIEAVAMYGPEALERLKHMLKDAN